MTIPLSPTTAIHASLLSNIEGHGFKKEINEKESVEKVKSIVEKSQKKHEEAIKILEQESNQVNHIFIELGNLKTKIFNHKIKILVNEVKKRKANASHLKNPSNFTEKSTDTQIKKIQLHSLEAKINLKMNGGIVGLKGSVSGSAIIVKKMAVDAQAEKALVKAEEYKAEVEKKILEINTKVETFRIEFKRLVSNWWVLLSSAFLFLVKMCLISSIPYFIAKSMHVQFAYDSSLLNFINTIAMTQFTTTITGMVPIPGASGASELVFQLMFAKFFVDCPQSTISAIIIIWRGVTFYLGLILGCITFFAYHEKPSSSEAFKGDPRRTLLELQVINVGNEKTKTIELAALSTP
ncbi:MAG: flippase-like domain-containing protein, partial [Comamonas sp.]|nr:flippase-like domain-containing protein [Comamonas sp.]